MSEYKSFVLRAKYSGSKTRRAVGFLIADKLYDPNFIGQAWDYAVKETSQKMQPIYEDAVKWLQNQHPEWQVISCDGYYDIDFEMDKRWAVKLYPPNTD